MPPQRQGSSVLSPGQLRPSASELPTTEAPANQFRSHRVDLDLLPGPLNKLVAMRPGYPSRLYRISKTNGVEIAAQDLP